jgi:predicted RNA-binding protein YlqC (UPF0109 family)
LSDPRDVSISKLLYKIVCAMVDQPEFVVIRTHVAEDGASFGIDVHACDIGKIIGKQGRNARSIRTVLSAIGKKLHRRYVIDIDNEPAELD